MILKISLQVGTVQVLWVRLKAARPRSSLCQSESDHPGGVECSFKAKTEEARRGEKDRGKERGRLSGDGVRCWVPFPAAGIMETSSCPTQRRLSPTKSRREIFSNHLHVVFSQQHKPDYCVREAG